MVSGAPAGGQWGGWRGGLSRRRGLMEVVGGRASLGGHKQSSYGCTNYLLDLMALMALYRSNTLSDDNDKQGTITKTQTDAHKRIV